MIGVAYMKVLVCIKSGYARDQQMYAGQSADDIHDEDLQHGWKDAFGSIVVATKVADNIQSALDEVAREYRCPAERFEGYELM